jgi:uncharacterized membrane protein YphA (DoxX/SURF4 family)
MACVSILTELLGGLAILLGAFVSVVSLPMAAAFVNSYFYCAFALRVQFDQAHGRDCYRRAVWTAGL